MDGSSAIWFGAPNFEVLDVTDDGHELVVAIESTMTVVGCSACGTRAKPKDRRWVSLRDAPASGRAVLLRWRKRVWSCPEPDCEVRTWTETSELAGARRVLTTRACTWATDRVRELEGTPASIARQFGVSWSTVWAAVERAGRAQVDDPDRVGVSAMVGFDETVMQPAHRRRRRRFTGLVRRSGARFSGYQGRQGSSAYNEEPWKLIQATVWPRPRSMLFRYAGSPHPSIGILELGRLTALRGNAPATTRMSLWSRSVPSHPHGEVEGVTSAILDTFCRRSRQTSPRVLSVLATIVVAAVVSHMAKHQVSP